jgi:hypothetical protein
MIATLTKNCNYLFSFFHTPTADLDHDSTAQTRRNPSSATGTQKNTGQRLGARERPAGRPEGAGLVIEMAY